MLITLLLQSKVTYTNTVEVTSLTNVYIALTGTIIAAVLAALASWNAAKTAERAANQSAATAQKVADLSRQTTREVAELSAQVSRESAGLAAQTAREIKETDYKHDFYKKIIERRMRAWEKAQELIALVNHPGEDDKDKKSIFLHCIDPVIFDNISNKLKEAAIEQRIWMSVEYGKAFTKLVNKHLAIRRESGIGSERDELDIIDNKLLLIAGKKYFSDIDQLLDSMIAMVTLQLPELEDVDSFLKRFDQPTDLESNAPTSQS